MRCYTFNKSTDKRITYTEEFGEKLQALGGGVVNIPPVVGRHPGQAILWRPVVKEVGQLLGRPHCAAELLVDGSGKHWIRKQGLISKARRWV